MDDGDDGDDDDDDDNDDGGENNSANYCVPIRVDDGVEKIICFLQ